MMSNSFFKSQGSFNVRRKNPDGGTLSPDSIESSQIPLFFLLYAAIAATNARSDSTPPVLHPEPPPSPPVR
jgi:hypothetical protein